MTAVQPSLLLKWSGGTLLIWFILFLFFLFLLFLFYLFIFHFLHDRKATYQLYDILEEIVLEVHFLKPILLDRLYARILKQKHIQGIQSKGSFIEKFKI